MAAQTPKSSYTQEMKELVAEQPGLLVSIVGIFIAVFLGLAVKALVAPEKIKEKIVQASSKVHSEIKIEVGEAFVSFSNGIFPELAVVIRQVTMVSEKQCWMRPQIEIDEIKLPISVTKLLQGRVYVHQLFANEIQMSLRSAPVPCGSNAQAETSDKPLDQVQVTRHVAQALDQAMNREPSKNTIDTIRVKKMMVSYLPIAFTSFELDNLSVKAHQKDLDFSSLLKLGGGTLVGDYSSQATIRISHKPSQGTNLWKLELKGLLREGHYDLFADYSPDENSVDVKLDVKHLPLGQVFPIMQKYKVFTAELNGKRIWLSLKANSKFNLKDVKDFPVSISGFRVEGDLGDISTREISIETFKPFKMKPVEFDLQGLDLNHFIVFLNRPHPSQALGNLGIFNGKAYYQDQDDVRISGEHSGLQFIFSNKGLREAQTLSLISGDLILRADKWTVNVNSLRPSGGLFEGNLKLQASKDWRELKLAANISELILAPPVQKVMTNGGDVGAARGQINLEVSQGELHSLKGNLEIERMLVESIEVKKANLKINNVGPIYSVDASVNSMKLNPLSPVAKYIVQVLPEDLQGEPLDLKASKIKLKTEKLKDLHWSDFSTMVSATKPIQILSNGGWDTSAQLKGTIKVRQSQKPESGWNIEGTREHPVLTKKAL